MSIDAITLEIIANRFDEIQRVMKHRLFRTGYSTILRESFDGGAGLTDRRGRVIGASGMTIHTRPYACFVAGILQAYGEQGVEDGDVFIWIGLIGKVLGPLGWIKTVWEGDLPARTFPLILCNDLIWWVPFLLYLFRNRAKAKVREGT